MICAKRASEHGNTLMGRLDLLLAQLALNMAWTMLLMLCFCPATCFSDLLCPISVSSITIVARVRILGIPPDQRISISNVKAKLHFPIFAVSNFYDPYYTVYGFTGRSPQPERTL